MKRRELDREKRGLPTVVAGLRAEGKKLATAMGDASETAKPLLHERLEDVGKQLAVHEARLAGVEEQLDALGDSEVEAGWVAEALAGFNAVWDVLTPENRVRLVSAVVDRVEVDERANRVTVAMANLNEAPRLKEAA